MSQDPRTSPQRRSRYLDALRAVAIVRVYLLHSLWLAWLPVVFPSMPIMFALAGYLTAVSLERGGSVKTITSRVRRLLPPLWLLAAVALPLMLLHGWITDPERPLQWTELVNWVLPLANPPSSTWGGPFAMALWYLRAYLWFVLISPVLWWAFRRWPVPALLLPATAAVLISIGTLPPTTGHIGDVCWSVAIYGSAWMLGFARHTGLLERVAIGWLAAGSAVLAVTGLVWADTHGVTLVDPVAEMFWGLAFVLIAMRIRPSFAWLDRVPGAARVVDVLNARAVSIYVWHLPALYFAGFLVAGIGPIFAVGTVFTVLAVAATGWVEDLAARRRPVLIPGAPAPLPAPAAAADAAAAAGDRPMVGARVGSAAPAIAAALSATTVGAR
ncbi:peptidoglycan/LPS O-acetylase OafA/YrhL [Allocatelliglobosispora scoriae]|uniref:Peptidoglycan/LPS O-acetylase OafA/YrhL n=1 Tax=Allocatelliglobosispora scoriae TaxID=643052 RepID=A0A841BLI8_9ACTN|nr:acyltransferase [Allocatelliglobosispora scoriae]MBB5867612.1 peptidoglycan/LPS O-acetylase OafA/YrhL [Allocatelliglobosispora scoriae]